MKTVNIIGAGNVAHHFALALYKSGHKISLIYNRTIERARGIADLVKSKATNDIERLTQSDVIIIAVSDDYIKIISEKIRQRLGNKINIVHTSGALGLDIFNSEISCAGIIWPLQSMVKNEKVDFANIQLCIDANNSEFLQKLMALGKRLSNNVIHLKSDQKEYAHIAAVFANNFSNHMFHLASTFCEKHNLDFRILLPLISGSVLRLKNKTAKEIQTGPARRMDLKTINSHLELIKDKKMKKLYRDISKSIINSYHENN